MKTKNTFSKAIAYSALFFCLMYSNAIKSQVAAPYPIVNNTSCNMGVTITFYNSSCVAISSTGVITITPGTTTITTPAGAVDVEGVANWCGNSACLIASQTPNPVGANAVCPNTQTGSLTWNAADPNCTCSPCAAFITTKLLQTVLN